jgi:hypothetical protein
VSHQKCHHGSKSSAWGGTILSVTYGAPFNQGFAGLRLAIVQTIILKAYSFHRIRHLASGKLERYTCIC